jgi:hypothetical protein
MVTDVYTYYIYVHIILLINSLNEVGTLLNQPRMTEGVNTLDLDPDLELEHLKSLGHS